MKIIHCSDLHLDSKMKSNLDSKKAKERRNEILITYQNMVKYAVENNVKIIIIAGDMFDKKNITQKARNIVIDTMKFNPEIDFIYLKGNHDEAGFLEQIEEIPSNLKLLSNKQKRHFLTTRPTFFSYRFLRNKFELRIRRQADKVTGTSIQIKSPAPFL